MKLAVLLSMALTGTVLAQDMPLSEILAPGETWKPHSGEFPAVSGNYQVDREKRAIVFGRAARADIIARDDLQKPVACTTALGGSTLIVALEEDRYLWAFRIEPDVTLGPGDRYCRMQVRGDERRRTGRSRAEDFQARPTALTTDAANRTYVATSLGIQIFDPTGRLCGVITAPPGTVTDMAFDGHRLVVRVEGRLFARTLLASGRKD